MSEPMSGKPVNRRIVLASRPKGEPRDEDFRMESLTIPEPGDGQVLLKTIYLSLDPYMRGRMSDAPSYATPVQIGEVITARTVSEVVESKSAGLRTGDIALCDAGWQEYYVTDPKRVQKLDPSAAPVSTALGVLGMPGLTAYTGMLNIGKPQPGETVVVGAAAGAVGAVVGQLAKIWGCRAVGIAGGPEKCAYVVKELGFDACVDHRSATLAAELKEACPKGIDIYFENVGGTVFEAVLPLLNPFARVPVCGLIAGYNATELPAGPNQTPLLMRSILTKRLTFRGFIVTDYASQYPEFLRDVSGWIKDGRMKYREDVVNGIENAVSAFQGLLQGKNFGKMLVKM
jgi:NADPH-dependent curcumin reductase CurA